MTKRCYKATDGVITVFRCTETKTYASANFRTYQHEGQWHCGRQIGFSGKPVPVGQFPTVEITEAEFAKLNAIKMRRLGNGGYITPSDSWVRNTDLEG